MKNIFLFLTLLIGILTMTSCGRKSPKPIFSCVIYANKNGELKNSSGERVCAVKTYSTSEPMDLNFSTEINWNGTKVEKVYLSDGKVFTEFPYYSEKDEHVPIATYNMRSKGGSDRYYDFFQISDAKIEKPIPEKLMESQNIKEISNLLNGTTWHYTEDLTTSEIGGWLKVKFNNGQFVTYYATPQDGKWTEGGRGKYEVSEGRYANTGEKYYAVSWEGKMMLDRLDLPCEMVMTIGKKGFQLNVTSSVLYAMKAITMGVNEAAYYAATHKDQVFSGRMEFGDYEWR